MTLERSWSILFLYCCADPGEAGAGVVRVRQILHSRGIQTETPYPVVLGSRDDLPRSHDLASRLILVPVNVSLGRKQIALITDALEEASKQVTRMFKPVVAIA